MSHSSQRHIHSSSYRPDIDGLRALAVLAVVGYHAFPSVFPGGFVGVDIFFVISGYLIGGILINGLNTGTFSFWTFYSRRILRIFPALVVMMVAVLLFGWHTLLPDEFFALGKHLFGGAAFISNFVFWQESGYFDVVSKSKPLLHLWSLGIEEQFYIAFPLILFLCAKKRSRFTVAIFVMCLLSFGYNLLLVRLDPTTSFFSPLTRVWEPLLGALLRAISLENHSLPLVWRTKIGSICKVAPTNLIFSGCNLRLGTLCSLLGTILLILALLLSRGSQPWPTWKTLLPVLGAAMLIGAGPRSWVNRVLLSNRIVVGIGLISYPLYLWHWPLISYAFVVHGGLGEDTRVLRVILVCVAFGLAVLTYRLLERPIRLGTQARSSKVWLTICCILTIAATGLFIWQKDGLPNRGAIQPYTAMVRAMNATSYPIRDEAGRRYAPTAPQDMYSYCGFTDTGSDTTIAVFGDSHARVAYSGIANVNSKLGINTFLLGAAAWEDEKKPAITVPFATLWRYAVPSMQEKTQQRTQAMLDILASKKDIKAIFIVSRGPLYLTGTEPSNPALRYPVVIPEAGFTEALQETVNIFNAAGKKVFIVTENPELSINPRSLIPRPLSKAKPLPQLTKADVMDRQNAYLNLLEKIRGATIINTIDLFCPEGECRAFTSEDWPLYRDADHLSIIGSDLQAEFLVPYLQKQLEENP